MTQCLRCAGLTVPEDLLILYLTKRNETLSKLYYLDNVHKCYELNSAQPRLYQTGKYLTVPITRQKHEIIIIIIIIITTIYEANYRLALGYHGIASSPLLNYIYFILLNHLFLTTFKYFPKFCMCVPFVIFIIFL